MSTPNTHRPHETDNVIPLRPNDTDVEPFVIDAEIVPDEPGTAIETRTRTAPGRAANTRAVVVATARRMHTVATHDTTKTVAKTVLRNVLYVPAGVKVVGKRVWDARTTSRYERMMRAAEAAGDMENLSLWEERGERFKAARHGRAMDWLNAPILVAKALLIGAISLLCVLIGLGVILACAQKDIAAFLDPFNAVLSFVSWVVLVVTVTWGPLVVAAPWVALAYVWNEGRRRATLPTWVTPVAHNGEGRDVVPDEGAIMSALRNLGIAKFNQQVKEGWMPRWVQPTTRDGKGWRTQLELPQGVNVGMINDRKDVLAHNLVRLPVEVWPTEPKSQPGVLDLWVADQGLLTGPVAPYPLLDDGTCDYFKGVPVGVDQRGDEVHGKLMASNYAVAGIMGSGKTSLVINLLCGAMLDPLVDIDVYVMADNVDYDAMRPRLRTLVKGDDEVTVPAAIEALRELRSMVSQRGQILGELGGEETKLTREIAAADPRMRPRVVVVDECQELFMHDKYGQEAKNLAIKLMMKARKVGITLIWVTPAPSADSLPRALAKTVSHRVCFAIGDHQGNDAILGTGAHKQGITATSLVAGEDIGTAMASGFAARPGLLRTHHIRKEKGIDQITPIVQRALALREDAGITDEPAPVETTVELDPLADTLTVLGQDKLVRAHEVIQRLAAHNPTAYRGWTNADLAAALGEIASPYKTKGHLHVSRDRVADAIAERDDETGDDEGDD